MRRPINPVIPYPHEAIQHTRCVLALSMITVAISFLKPETLALLGDLGKQVEKVNRWIDRCADDTQKRRLSAGAKRDLDARFHILAQGRRSIWQRRGAWHRNMNVLYRAELRENERRKI